MLNIIKFVFSSDHPIKFKLNGGVYRTMCHLVYIYISLFLFGELYTSFAFRTFHAVPFPCGFICEFLFTK